MFSKRTHLILLALIILPLLLTGCMPRIIAETANVAVSKYCKIPNAGRTAVRKVVDSAVRPNRVEINCAED
jgi:hypothetical protein